MNNCAGYQLENYEFLKGCWNCFSTLVGNLCACVCICNSRRHQQRQYCRYIVVFVMQPCAAYNRTTTIQISWETARNAKFSGCLFVCVFADWQWSLALRMRSGNGEQLPQQLASRYVVCNSATMAWRSRCMQHAHKIFGIAVTAMAATKHVACKCNSAFQIFLTISWIFHFTSATCLLLVFRAYFSFFFFYAFFVVSKQYYYDSSRCARRVCLQSINHKRSVMPLMSSFRFFGNLRRLSSIVFAHKLMHAYRFLCM